ncbi:exopolyphosphatase / guanosine-5'-triphosphate,3'-diphosphate pyrophosphatase [Marinobacter gudaonensis]|uniref:Exopolyphosphatase n=1 Tax=Marinobacter gudaonensis TaxID=375760 RepID=A0A1I6H7L7_9GAMM|nr:exopolyphosphatase [Marinobacter gudaonensis]SFR50556.1 exopolyphosphatase / guanosine-5'-triphosphate,3'-diphosphate pyrophosphatase [Marinobacter gudaonensis]
MTAASTADNAVSPPEVLAAIDMGSNSFHMVVARLVHGEIRTLEKMGEKVQLGAGLDPNNRLTEDAQERALACLGRFAQRLKGMPPEAVQIVGTNALRVARNAHQFMNRAEEVLGYPVEIIAGREEARLIYLGVAHTLSDDSGRRLVIDIGGGSTEFIIGQRFEPLELESLHMGCVSFRNRYFADGKITRRQMDRAVTHAEQEMLNIRQHYRNVGWQSTVGSSGSIKAIANVLANLKITDGTITLTAMQELRKRLVDMGKTERLGDLGVRADRQSIFPAGFAILMGAFQSLGISEMAFADGALREGLLYDIAGRIQHEDVRERTISALQERYHVDQEHGAAVEQTAIAAWRQVARDWGLNTPADEEVLRWACRLHEIGLTISHSQYHKHGAYLLRYSDLPGFTQQFQKDLATLVRGHRRKFSPAIFEGVEPEDIPRLRYLCVLVRLAVLLQHPRNLEAPPEFTLTAKQDALALTFPDGWLDDRPLTLADLENERDYLAKQDFTLELNGG